MDPTPVPDVPNLDWWNQLRKQEQQNAPNKPPAPAPGSPQAMSSALMGGQDPYENMHGTGPQGNVANSALSDISSALLRTREGISGQTQPSAEDLASGKVQIPSWQSAIPQAVGLGMQGQGMGGALEGAALHLIPRITTERGASISELGRDVYKQQLAGLRDYNIVDDSKKLVGNMQTMGSSPFPEKINYGYAMDPGTVGVSLISGVGANKLGPKEIASLIPELKREYPDMNLLTGDRVTGARKGKFTGEAQMKIPESVKPASPTGYKPDIVNPLTNSEEEAIADFERNLNRGKTYGTGNYVSNNLKDRDGNIHLYGDDYSYIGTIPAKK